MTLQINPKFRDLITPLATEELKQLEANIIRDGCRDPLVLWNDTLVDGHNRHDICNRNNLAFKTVQMQFESELHVELWIRLNQAGRRNLTDDQRAMNADAALEIEAKISRADQARKVGQSGGRGNKKTHVDAASSGVSIKKDRARSKLAKKARVSERKLKQARKVRKSSKALAKKVEDGELTLSAALREIKKTEVVDRLELIAAETPKTPTGQFDVVVIDPPWMIQKIERDCRENQTLLDYPAMSYEDIRDELIPDFFAEDCHIFLWTIQKYLPVAFELLRDWRVSYAFTMVWHKPGGFQPIGLPQFNCEFVLYGRIGNPIFIDTKAFPTCFNAKRGDHSEKPEEFYALLRRVTAGRRLDYFNRRAIEGFIGAGKEAK